MAGINRRGFLQATGAASVPGFVCGTNTPASARAADSSPVKYRLGIVTYNIAQNWDVPTIVKVCKNVGLSPVELRTTHTHGVEPLLNKDQRREVRKRFADSGIDIWGCGTVCEFQSPDPAVVNKNIETCKQFVELAADIGGRGVKASEPVGVADLRAHAGDGGDKQHVHVAELAMEERHR